MRRTAGFTLVELIVTLFMMALMGVLGWRGLDGMARAHAQADTRADQLGALQAGLAQWGADLDALAQLPQTTALEWDGRVLRMTRRAASENANSLHVVAWTQRRARWLRWQSPPLLTRSDVSVAWGQAGLWAQRAGDLERGYEVSITPLQSWQIFYFRGDSWVHPLSSDASAPAMVPHVAGAAAVDAARTVVVPDGMRLVLMLPQGQALPGRIVRDWASPKLGGGKS